MAEEWITVEVAAALPDRQALISLRVPAGTTAQAAVARSGIAERLPELTIDPDALGIFGKRCRPDRVLVEGDRVEIYRPLTADPREVRRRLAELERNRKSQ